jgi:flavin-binding protein dodecin
MLPMPSNVYKHIQLTGTSNTSMEDAIQGAIARAAKTVRNMRWMEVLETRGSVENGRVLQWQVTIKAGFTLEE